jgi:hypothetical protein
LSAITDAIIAPKRKQVKKSTAKRNSRPRPRPSPSSSENEEEAEEASQPPPKSRLSLVDVKECTYEVVCTTTTIEDPTDWEHLEETIAHYMKERIKMLRIDYIVTFIKTWRHGNSGQTDEHDDSEMAEDKRVLFRQHRRYLSHAIVNCIKTDLGPGYGVV